MTTTTFQPDILLNPTSLNRFISGEREAAEILLAARSPAATTQGRTFSDSFIDTDELYYLAQGILLTIGSYILHAVCMADLSKRVWVESRHALNNASIAKTDKIFQNSLLSRAINTHRLDTADFFLSPPVPTTLATHPTPNTLQFFHRDGICRGMSHWFIHLYFKTRGMIPDSDACMRAVGKQFEQGAPQQAAFLHSLDFPPLTNLLHLNIRTDYSKIKTAGKTQEQIISEFRLRPPGVYGIYTSSHQVVYIKVDENRQYLFDANTGVVKVESALLFKNAMERYFESHDHKKDILIDLYTPR